MPKGKKEHAILDRDSAADSRKIWGRHKEIKVRVTPGHYADLNVIAKAWNTSITNVVWLVMSTWIDDALRDRDSLDLPYRKVSRDILLRVRKMERALEEEEYE